MNILNLNLLYFSALYKFRNAKLYVVAEQDVILWAQA